ncbi:hypothetical protein [Leucobacter aridicollis]|uniref:hypothetical protein n=1 Tax=Leucobacter aridicollis TaxID=283878 RepID=UPI002105B94A|nr:hypothetical protein [Leucobacter aridicollis]UTX53379.1 hypothetical protein KI794_01030 [Leucobacter aridicollis]
MEALAAEDELQSTHPVWVNDPPFADAGTPEAEEWAALTADEEAQWLAIMRPVYETCEGPDDWWAVVQRHPGLAGMTGPEFVTPDMLGGWCYDDPSLAACSGYDEWLEDKTQ